MKAAGNRGWIAGAAAGGLAYPFLVYFGTSAVRPVVLTLVALALIALRVVSLRGIVGSRIWIGAFALAGLALLVLLVLSPELAVRAYPVAVSLTVAAVFASSLKFPPTAIEVIARLTEPDLTPAGISYTCRVTQVWVVFLLGNAAVAAGTALWGTLEQWTLWNGALSYVAMGCLFLGERAVRRMRRGWQTAP